MDFINMDKRFQIMKISMLLMTMLLLPFESSASGFGFDSANSCSPNGKLSRRGRAQMLATIPCDLTQQGFCQLPGTAYPWHAVRRFVHENQGLMKRMYGDVRHISILRDEIQNNEIELDDVENAADRYTKDAGAKGRAAKYMQHNRDEYLTYNANGNNNNNNNNNKANDVLMEPHFRPVATSSTTTKTTTTKATPTTAATATMGTTIAASKSSISSRRTTTVATPTTADNPANIESTTVTNDKKRPPSDTSSNSSSETDLSDEEDIRDLSHVESNSVYEQTTATTASGDNIQIIESPKFGTGLHNLSSEASTISTTLRMANTAKTAPSAIMTAAQRFPSRRKTSAPAKAGTAPTTVTTTTTTTTTTKAATSPSSTASSSSSSSSSTSLKTSSSTAMLFRGYAHRNASTNNNNNYYSNHRRNPQPMTTTTTTATAAAAAAASSISTHAAASSAGTSLFPPSTSFLTLKSQTDNREQNAEKLRRPATSSPTAATTSSPTATKPLIRDGQLFQDTMKQEPAAVVNKRGVNACPVKEEVVAPFWANNTRGEVLALLNLYPFEQYVHWEKCTHEYKQMYCRDGCRCEQQYRLHRLLAYDPHNECRGIFSDWFRFPSSCICMCYDIPLDFRATSRSPRSDNSFDNMSEARPNNKSPIEVAEEQVKHAIYEHATEQWYRPRDEYDLYDG